MTRGRALLCRGLLAALCVAFYPWTVQAAEAFPADAMTFENFGGKADPKITRVFCSSPKDGKVVVAFADSAAKVSAKLTATILVDYQHKEGNGRDVLVRNADVSKFVAYGEVRHALSPKHAGTYQVTIESFHDGETFAVARYTQVH